MKNTVYVTAEGNNQVIINSNDNPTFGYIRLEQKRTVIRSNGWVSSKTLSALLHGTVEELECLNFVPGQVIPGKIVIKESLTPFNMKNPLADVKVAGDTGIICMLDGMPIYRKCFYTTNDNDQDETIAHNNKEEIRLANEQLKSESSDITADTEEESSFSL